jgi:hypothetical protein
LPYIFQMDAAASGGPPLSYGELLCFQRAGGARSGKRTMATEQIRNDIELADLLRGRNDKDQEMRRDRKPSWASSTLVGAIVLARPVPDETLSREILKSVAALLKQQH